MKRARTHTLFVLIPISSLLALLLSILFDSHWWLEFIDVVTGSCVRTQIKHLCVVSLHSDKKCRDNASKMDQKQQQKQKRETSKECMKCVWGVRCAHNTHSQARKPTAFFWNIHINALSKHTYRRTTTRQKSTTQKIWKITINWNRSARAWDEKSIKSDQCHINKNAYQFLSARRINLQ